MDHGSGHALEHAVVLHDGTSAVIRRLRPDDVDAVVALADSLSDDERYHRFFTVHPRYLCQWASSLVDPAPDAVALGAFDHGSLVGMANYTPADAPHTVEISVLIGHQNHDRGLCTALLTDLAALARRAGHHRAVADVLVENTAMRRVLLDAHVPVTWHRDGSVYSVEIDLRRLANPSERTSERTLERTSERTP